jgi:Alpha-mannosidase
MGSACFVVASAHWDREWYRSFDSFRIRLCDLMGRLIDTLESDQEFRCFTLDGQTAPLDDYLELYPEQEARLRELVASGRLSIGPFYVLADSFLVSGEGLIRNLLAGREACERFGARSSAGYLPDMFGHCSQLPQILKAFGIESAILYRGIEARVCKRSEFLWRGADGTAIQGYHLAYGYWNLKSWGLLGKGPVEHFDELLGRLEERSATGCHLMINGSDHLYPQPEMPAYVAMAAKAHPELDVRNASLDRFAAELVKSCAGIAQETVAGELRYARDAQIEASVYSTRCDIKRLGRRAETQLEAFAEPLSSFAALLGRPYPAGPLGRAWKELILNYPHDSVCTVSTDEVHEDVASRYRHSISISEELVSLAIDAIAQRVAARSSSPCDRLAIVFNPHAWQRKDAVVATVDFPLASGARDIVLFSPDGRPCDYELLGSQELSLLKEREYESKQKIEARRFTFRFIAEVPPLGYAAYRVAPLRLREKRQYQQRQMLASMDCTIENEYFAVEVDRSTASLTVRDKESGEVWRGLNAFCDRGDCGDEYQYASPLRDECRYPVLESLSVERNSPTRSAIRMEMRLRLPLSLGPDRQSRSADTVDCSLRSTVSLCAGVRRVDFETVFDNRAEDHILYARFPFPGRPSEDFAHSAFDIAHRAIDIPPVDEEDNEVTTPFKPMHSFAGLSDGERTMAVANRGIYEYRTDREGENACLSLTLLRATGWLFREVQASSRDGQPCTTPVVACPRSQCKGEQSFEYSFMASRGALLEGGLHKRAFEFARPLAVAAREASPSGELSGTFSLIELSSPMAVLSSITKAEDGGILLRFYNISDEGIETEVGSAFAIESIERRGMGGESLGPVELAGGKGRLRLRGKEIATLRIVFRATRAQELP